MLRIDSSLRHLLFRKTILFRTKIPFLKQVLVESIKYFITATFSAKLILLKRYLLRSTSLLEKLLFLEIANFSEKQYSVNYFFNLLSTQLHIFSRATLLIIFQKTLFLNSMTYFYIVAPSSILRVSLNRTICQKIRQILGLTKRSISVLNQ